MFCIDNRLRLILLLCMNAPQNARKPLDAAARKGHAKCVELLLAAQGVELNADGKQNDGHELILWAVEGGNAKMLELLLHLHQVNPNVAKKASGFIASSLACQTCDYAHGSN